MKNRLEKKFLALTLVSLMFISALLGGCEKKTSDNPTKDKPITNEQNLDETRSAFDNYMKELFVEEMSADSVTTHFNLENPEAYGISFDEASWGEPITTELVENSYKEQKKILDRLEEFDYSQLSAEQKLTYDTLYTYLNDSYSARDYYLFEELFSPIGGTQSSIPIIFSEYDFFTDKDIEDYLTLLETIDDYVNSLLEYECVRAENGYFLTESSVDTVVEQCEDFIYAEENCLVSIFSDKLDEYGVSESDKATYMSRFNSAIESSLIPAYENIIDTLTELKGCRETPLGLSAFKDGKEYYEALVRSYTGSDESVEDLIEMVEESMSDDINLVYKLLLKNENLYDEFDTYVYPDKEPKYTILEHIELAKEYFPETKAIPFEVKSVPKSLEASMNPAFYLVPPVDNPNKNMIYINYSEDYESMNLYTTLAHEGVPGHLYQCYYFASTNPDPIRNVVNIGGYSEGWATYIEYYAYLFAGMDDNLAEFAAANDRYNLAIYCRIDMGIHYEGWDTSDVYDYLGSCGIEDEKLANTLYETLVDDPAVYLQYYIGYLEFNELLEEALNEVEDFDIVEFHRFILETGPTYFEIIEEQLKNWIDAQNS